MGLDQYAHTGSADGNFDEKFKWRKHAKLQAFMEMLWYHQLGNNKEFNCQNLELERNDIEQLQALIKGDDLPESPGGFFSGHQFQDQSASDYKETDLEFCDWALEEIDNGRPVFYTCWY